VTIPSPGPGARKPIPSPGPGAERAAGKQIPSPGPATREQAPAGRAPSEQPGPPSLPPPPPEVASGSRTRSRPPWSYVYAALALAALSLALAVGAVATGTTLGGGGSEGDRAAALEATRQRTVALTSYDYRKLDQDFGGVLATATGSFSEEYAKATAELKASFAATESVATSQVVAAGLESFEPDRAVAVVAVDQQISAKGAQPRIERNRLRMTLVRGKDTWLVEKVERL
jgi:Mce-associated membrane protein